MNLVRYPTLSTVIAMFTNYPSFVMRCWTFIESASLIGAVTSGTCGA